MKRILFYVMLWIALATVSHNVNADDFQAEGTISFFSESFLKSLEDAMKNPEYAQTILPNNFGYLVQLLDRGIRTHQPRSYTRSVFKVFGNMLKSSQYVNADAFSRLLDQLPRLLEKQFMPLRAQSMLRTKNILEMDLFDRFQETVSTMLYTKFSSHYDYFKQDPEGFLDQISSDIMHVAEEEVSIEGLRQSIVRFLETAIGKLVWSPQDQHASWDSVKHIARQITSLMDCNVLSDIEDVDDCFWSLIHRFCFFLDITGSEMSIDFYERVKNDMATKQLLLLELEEQATFIESKSDCLLRAILTGEARRRCIEQKEEKTSLTQPTETQS